MSGPTAARPSSVSNLAGGRTISTPGRREPGSQAGGRWEVDSLSLVPVARAVNARANFGSRHGIEAQGGNFVEAAELGHKLLQVRRGVSLQPRGKIALVGHGGSTSVQAGRAASALRARWRGR